MKFEGKLSETRAEDLPENPPVETISQLLLAHAQSPKNLGELETTNGMAVGFGSCGDSMTVQLLVENGAIEEIKYIPDGCLYTVVCGSMMTDMVKGLPLEEALKLQPEDIDTILGGLPSDHQHCARLAVNTLGEAIEDYHCRNGFPDEPDDMSVKQ